MSVTALSLDPIAQFLRDRHLPGTATEVLERDRLRLARFRHAYPGLPLQRLGDEQIAEHCRELARTESREEVEEVGRLCREFARFAHREPTLGSGLLRLPDPDREPERESPYLLDGPAGPARRGASPPSPLPPSPPSADAPNALAVILKIAVVGLVLLGALVLAKELLQ